MLNVILSMFGIWLIVLFILFNKLTKGALIQIIKAKLNKKLKLVKVYSLNEIYFTTGKYIDAQLEIKQRHKDKFTKKKDTKKISVNEDMKIYRVFGIDCFEVFEKDNDFKFIENGLFNTVSTYDATLQDLLVERAIMRPSLKDEEISQVRMMIIIAIAVSGLAFIAAVYGITIMIDLQKSIEVLAQTAIPLI